MQVLRRHGDEFERTCDGYYRAHGRADDTMNLGGIKVYHALWICGNMQLHIWNVSFHSPLIQSDGPFQVSSIEIERICNRVNDAILETAAIGVPPIGGGPEQLTIAVVLKDQSSQVEDLNQLKLAFNAALKKLNPLFKVPPLFVCICHWLHPGFMWQTTEGVTELCLLPFVRRFLL